MKVLLGTLSCNQHVNNIAAAFHEAGCLGLYFTGAVDHFQQPWSRAIRRQAGRLWKGLQPRMARRRISEVPEKYIQSHWTWEGLRLAAQLLPVSEIGMDWLWERSERSFDRLCERLIRHSDYDTFCGVEYGCLEAISAARAAGKKTIVAFQSPHHRALEKWVYPEYDRFPELLTPYVKHLRRLLPERTARKDEEARLADCIHTASDFTARSLAEAGHPRAKINAIPFGCPQPATPDGNPMEDSSTAASGPVRFIYAGNVSVQKGVHYLLQSWRELKPGRHAQLDLYGRVHLPKRCFDGFENVVVHGAVAAEELNAAYRQSSVLVFPTLCDGFGLVVGEAFAQGLPVLTTSNAGAADLVEQGKNGFVIPPRNVDALKERLEWCIANPKELSAMRPHALSTAKRRTWDRFRSDFLRETIDLLGMN